MYTRTKQFIKSSANLSPNLFIDGNDIHNSEVLVKLDRLKDRKLYEITKFEHRIDLISNDIYKTSDYSWVLLYMNRIKIEDLVRGTYIEYVPEDEIRNVINSL